MKSDQDTKAIADPQVQTAPKDTHRTPLPPQLPDLTRSAKTWTNHMASLDTSVTTPSMVVQSEHEQSDGSSQARTREEETQKDKKSNLRKTLTKTLQFCLSRENLFSDMYLVSQMDSDQYVPIVTVANLDHIKSISTDMGLIVDILTSLPNLQVDESSERVRLNQDRCIVILREIPQSTPVQEIEALFQTKNLPKFISCEFAYNDSWFITFQTEAAAQQAYKYLREEVKTFQGTPIKARIKAKAMARNAFQQVGAGPSCSPPTFHHFLLPPVQSPPFPAAQQIPCYTIIPHTHTALQVAPFPNSSFMHNYSPLCLRTARAFHRTHSKHQRQRGVYDNLIPSQSSPSQTHCTSPQPAGIGYPSHDLNVVAMSQPISSECAAGVGRTKREERLTDGCPNGRICSPVSTGRAMMITPLLPSNLVSPPNSVVRPTYNMENLRCERETQVSVERMYITVTTANKSVQVNGFATEGCKPSYAEICQRIKDSSSGIGHTRRNQQPREATPTGPWQLLPGPDLLTPPTSPQ